MVSRGYSKFVINENSYFLLKRINDYNWTEIYYVQNDKKTYLGAEVYKKIIENFDKYLLHNEIGNICEYNDEKIFSILILSDPHCCIYRTEDYTNCKLLIQNNNLQFTNEIKVNAQLLKFE